MVSGPWSKDLFHVKLSVGPTSFGVTKELFFYDASEKADKKFKGVKEVSESPFFGFTDLLIHIVLSVIFRF